MCPSLPGLPWRAQAETHPADIGAAEAHLARRDRVEMV